MLTVLVISNDTVNSWPKQFQATLEEVGQVTKLNKSKALDELRRTRFDVVIVDENQLIGDYEFIQRILNIQAAARVIVVTKEPDWRRARQSFQYGAVDYIATSMTPQDLIAVLQNI